MLGDATCRGGWGWVVRESRGGEIEDASAGGSGSAGEWCAAEG